ncbi:TPA: hypothetical protein ONC59_004377 [Enterobacter hormaechei subsp. steigerwaltii]|nr:hypothetical protein [Enterobacter hormaechei subsp. steigerwaltii]
MAEDIKFVVVGHVSRIVHAQRLAAMLDAHLLIDDGTPISLPVIPDMYV